MKNRVIIDTDTGVDDALALIFALRSPELEIEAITTVCGNVGAEKCARNARMVVELVRPEFTPPVAAGEVKPLVRELFTAPEVHGTDGVGEITKMMLPNGTHKYPKPSIPLDKRPAPELIAELARKHGSELTIITLGPLTNIARAIELDRKAMESVGEIVMMGGAFQVYGNTFLVAEFNIYVDPEAAAKTLEIEVPITILPLDATEQVRLMRVELDELVKANPSKLAEFVRDVSSYYMDYHRNNDGFDGCFLHDPVTVGAVIDRSIIKTVRTKVSVETEGELTRGMTIAELRPSRLPKETNASVAVEINAKRFMKLFLGRVITAHQDV